MNVYLAGPISGVTYIQAVSWRGEAAYLLGALGIGTYDPMCGKTPPLGGYGAIIGQGDQLNGMTPSEVFERDMADIDKCDMLLVNLEDFRGSIGTPFEIGRAWSEGKDIVVFGADKWVSHPFSKAFTHMAANLEDAVGAIEQLYARYTVAFR